MATENTTYFTGSAYINTCVAWGIQHTRTKPFHLHVNITERVNHNLKHMLIALADKHKYQTVHLFELDLQSG